MVRASRPAEDPPQPGINPFDFLCSSWTHRLITAKDHASVQINVGIVDPATGRYTGDFKTYAICGYIRSKVRLRLPGGGGASA